MLIDNFAMTCEDDSAGSHRTAKSAGAGESLSAAEPVGIAGGDPAPAPAATASMTNADPPQDPADQFVGLDPGSAAMERFVEDYLQLLDGRVDAIRRCLDDSDIEGARIAVMSLESSSLMLGGGPLPARLAELRAHLDLGSAPQRTALMALVESAATTFRRELQAVPGR